VVKQANERDKQQKWKDEYWCDDKKNPTKQCFLIWFICIKFQNDQEQKEAVLSASKVKAKPDLVPRKITQAQIQQRQEAAAPTGIVHLWFSFFLIILFY
jgi:hypothetical protein